MSISRRVPARAALLTVMALCTGALSASQATLAAAGTTAPAHRAGSDVRVWVALDGDTPLRNARVRVFTDSDRDDLDRRVEPTPREDSRTDENGIVVLDLDRLPKRGFTLVADDGRAKRDGLHGRMFARVNNYRPRFDIVYLNPVTTLAYHLWADNPGMPAKRADREARKTLRIPSFHDSGADLLSTDKWFDGDQFQREVADEGSVGDVMRDLTELSDASGSTNELRDQAGPNGDAAFVLALADKDDDKDKGGSLVDKIDVSALLDKLAGFAKGQFQDVALEGGKLLLGYLLDQWGLKDVKEFLLPRSASSKILEKLDTLLDAVTRVEGKVDDLKTIALRSDYTRLRNDLVPYEGVVENLYNQYRMINSMTNVADRREAAGELARSIKADLASKQGNLGRLLGGDDIGRDTVFKAASRLLGNQPMFTRDGTEKVLALYKTLSVLQLQEAVLLAEYHNAEFDRHRRDPDQAVAVLSNARDAVVRQSGQLKRAPDAGVVVDTNTRRVWTRTGAEPVRNGNDVFQAYIEWFESSCTKSRCFGTLGSQTRFNGDNEKWRKIRKQLGGSYGSSYDWRPASLDDIKQLYVKRGPASPMKFLMDQAGMGDFLMGRNAGGPYLWGTDSFEYIQYPTYYWFGASRLDLNSGDVTRREFKFNSWGETFPWPKWGNDYVRDGNVNRVSRIFRELQGISANVLYWRPLTGAEDYYYQ